MSINEKYEIPTILYEEPQPGAKPNPIPYIEVLENKTMPPVLFIFEYKHTGETEPDHNGEPAAIIDQIPHKYVDLEFLKERLPPQLNDTIRTLLGMKPLKEAQKEGQAILDKVNNNVEKLKEAKAKKENWGNNENS